MNCPEILPITQIRIFPFETPDPDRNLRAYAEVEISHAIVIRGIRILESKAGGLFIALPSIRSRQGDYHEIVLIRDRSFLKYLRRQVIDAFKNYEGVSEPAQQEVSDETERMG